MEEREAQRLDRLQDRQSGVFAGAAATGDTGLDLEGRHQVVRQDDQLLPGTVGRVAHRRNGVEGEPTLELTDGLLLMAAPGREIPEVGDREAEVAGDRRVLIVPVVRIEQVELEVFRGLMR